MIPSEQGDRPLAQGEFLLLKTAPTPASYERLGDACCWEQGRVWERSKNPLLKLPRRGSFLCVPLLKGFCFPGKGGRECD